MELIEGSVSLCMTRYVLFKEVTSGESSLFLHVLKCATIIHCVYFERATFWIQLPYQVGYCRGQFAAPKAINNERSLMTFDFWVLIYHDTDGEMGVGVVGENKHC